MNAGEQALLLGRAMTVGKLLDGVDAKALMASTGTAADGKAEWQTWRASLPDDVSFLAWRTRPETSLFANLNTAATVDLDDLTPENILYYHFNHLGSTAAMTDRTGALFREMQYLPYGQLRAEYGRSAAGGDYGFIGKERDAETGFHYDEARYLAAHLGRFLSVDPLGTDGGMNVYGYVNGNPIRMTDANGLEAAAATLILTGTGGTAAVGVTALVTGALCGSAYVGTYLHGVISGSQEKDNYYKNKDVPVLTGAAARGEYHGREIRKTLNDLNKATTTSIQTIKDTIKVPPVIPGTKTGERQTGKTKAEKKTVVIGGSGGGGNNGDKCQEYLKILSDKNLLPPEKNNAAMKYIKECSDPFKSPNGGGFMGSVVPSVMGIYECPAPK